MKFLAWALIPIIIFVVGVIIDRVAKWSVYQNNWWAGPLYFAVGLPLVALGFFGLICAAIYPFVSL